MNMERSKRFRPWLIKGFTLSFVVGSIIVNSNMVSANVSDSTSTSEQSSSDTSQNDSANNNSSADSSSVTNADSTTDSVSVGDDPTNSGPTESSPSTDSSGSESTFTDSGSTENTTATESSGPQEETSTDLGTSEAGTPTDPIQSEDTTTSELEQTEAGTPSDISSSESTPTTSSSSSVGDTHSAPVIQLDPPINFGGIAISENEISLKWELVPNATGYFITRDGLLLAEVPQSNLGQLVEYVDQSAEPNQQYEYAVKAYNSNGQESAMTAVLLESYDTIPPEPPTGFKAEEVTEPNNVHLSWDRVTDAQGYIISRDGIQIADVSGGENLYTDTLAEPNLTYTYSVQAYDQNRNISEPVHINVLTLDTMPPSIPEGVKGKAVASNQIHLTWNPSKDNRELDHYNIYIKRDGLSFESAGRSDANLFISDRLGHGRNYEYKITAVDKKGNESQYSEIVQITTPNNAKAIVYEALPPTFVDEIIFIDPQAHLEKSRKLNQMNNSNANILEESPITEQEKHIEEQSDDVPVDPLHEEESTPAGQIDSKIQDSENGKIEDPIQSENELLNGEERGDDGESTLIEQPEAQLEITGQLESTIGVYGRLKDMLKLKG